MAYQIVTEVTPEIFRAYDIRGVVERELSEDVVYTIGLAIGSEILAKGKSQSVVGRDGRLSGAVLSEALIAGIAATGCHVVDIGEVTTPMVYYQAAIEDCQTGIVLSGSHNPPEYNGIKMVIAGETLYGAAIERLYSRIVEGDFKFGTGSISRLETTDDYLAKIGSDVKLARPLKVVVDSGNGVGGKIAPRLFRALGCEVVELYCDVDGSFPNHHPDPAVPENLQDLIGLVEREQADVGLAFDGDADRVGIVTEQGAIIVADRLLTLLALDLLQRHPGATIIFDVKCGRQLVEQISQHGGVPLMYKTGHSLIKAKLRELPDALLAGEMSGHIFMRERWLGFDDGIYVAARFLEILAASSGSCSALFRNIPESHSTPELKVAVVEERKFKIMEELARVAQFPGGMVNYIDGVRVDYPDGFGLVRPSNTSPYLIVRFEGDDPAALARIQTIFRNELHKVDPGLQLPF